MSRTDSSGQDELREAVEALRLKWRTFDVAGNARAHWMTDLDRLLAEHPATPTEETAEVACTNCGDEHSVEVSCSANARLYGQTAEVADEDREAWSAVLYDHREDALTCYDHPEAYCCVCGEHEVGGYRAHLATILAALTANAKAEVETLQAEVISWQDRVAYLENELDADAKHAALGEGEFCVVCTHLESEQVQEWMTADLDWQDRAIAAKVEVDDLRARLAKVEADHRVIWERPGGNPEIVCSCGAHLSVYGLTRSLASVFAEHVRTIRTAALANPDAAGEGAEACVKAPLATSGPPDDQRRHPQGQQDASEENG